MVDVSSPTLKISTRMSARKSLRHCENALERSASGGVNLLIGACVFS